MTNSEIDELVIQLNSSLAALAQMHPNATAIAGISAGRVLGPLAFTAEGDNNFSPVSMEQVLALAKVVTSLPEELQAAFRIALNFAQTERETRAQIEATREAVTDAQILSGQAPKSA